MNMGWLLAFVRIEMKTPVEKAQNSRHGKLQVCSVVTENNLKRQLIAPDVPRIRVRPHCCMISEQLQSKRLAFLDILKENTG
jgi:hypothetical protein